VPWRRRAGARDEAFRQQRVDGVDVGRLQLARGLAQAQAAHQHVVARLGQVALVWNSCVCAFSTSRLTRTPTR
jgi:hypothetical protein